MSTGLHSVVEHRHDRQIVFICVVKNGMAFERGAFYAMSKI